MPPARNPTNRSLIRLCSLAEKTVVLLTEVPRVRAAFQSFRFDVDAEAARLVALAREGRDAHTERLCRRQDAETAVEEARELAVEAFEAQGPARKRLRALAILQEDPHRADDLRATARFLRLRSPRVPSAIATWRTFALALERADHPAHDHPATDGALAEARGRVAALEEAFRVREDALRLQRIGTKRARVAREALRDALRRMRKMGDVAATREPLCGPLFDYLRPPARRRGGSSGVGGPSEPVPGVGVAGPGSGKRGGSARESGPGAGKLAHGRGSAE